MNEFLTKISKAIFSVRFYILCFITGAILAGVCVFAVADKITNVELNKLHSEITGLGQTIGQLGTNIKELEGTRDKLVATNNGLEQSVFKRQETITGLEQSNRERQKTIAGLEQSNRDRQKIIDGITIAIGKIGSGFDSAGNDIQQARKRIQSVITDLSVAIRIVQAPNSTR